VTDVWDFRIQ